MMNQLLRYKISYNYSIISQLQRFVKSFWAELSVQPEELI
jgi:hypothetical protein